MRTQDPRSTFFGPTFTGVPPGSGVVALTFDDGPNGAHTQALLDVLAEEEVRATFFVVGRAASKQPALLQRMQRDGHAIGNHTWSHTHLNVRTRRAIARELSATDNAIFSATGMRTRLVRPPFGARSFFALRVLRELGYTSVLWSVPLAHEWHYPGSATIAQRILSWTQDGAVIALHDGDRGRPADRSQLPHAVRSIVRGLRERGLGFITVPEMIAGPFLGTAKNA